MKHLLFYTLILAAFPAWSQEPVETEHLDFGHFTEEDKTAFVFADVANVRTTPDVNAKIVERLRIGTEVEILDLTETPYSANGLQTVWLQIRAVNVTGYVPATSLTKGKLRLADDRFALWGITEKKMKGEEEQYFASVRVTDASGTLQTKQDFEVFYGDQPDQGSLTVRPAPMIDGAQNLIVYESLSEACGVYASSHYMLYDESGKLHFVGSGWSMGDSGVLHTSKAYVFPYYGEDYNQDYHFALQEGHIYCVEYTDGYDEDCLWVVTIRVADFTWTGTALEKACEY